MTMITYETLRVKAPIPVYQVLDFSMEQKMDAHAKAFLKVRIGEGVLLEELQKNLSKQSVTIFAQEEKPLFAGIIEQVYCSEENGYTVLTFILLSGTILLDLEKKSRSFQDIQMTYQEVIKTVLKDTEHSTAIFLEEMCSTPIGYPIIQYLETDWEFIKRLASHFQTSLIPELTRGEPKFWIGKPTTSQTHTVENAEYEAVSDRRFYDQGGTQKGYERKDFFHIDLFWYEDFTIGEQVLYQGDSFLICGKKCAIHGEVLQFTYTLAKESFFRYNHFYNQKIAGMSLLGEVLKTKSETVKVHLDIDAVQEVETAYPYHWVPATGNIMYLMPKVGTRVSLYFPDEHEGNARLTSCVRTNGGMGEKNQAMTHYENRQLLTEHNKNMYLYPEEMGFVGIGSDTTSLTIVENDQMGILFQSHKFLQIEAIKSISIDANTIFIGAKKDLTTRRGVYRGETQEEVDTRVNRLLDRIDSGQIPTGVGMKQYETAKIPQQIADITSSIVLESDTGQRIFYTAPLHRYVGYYYSSYPMFVDTPMQQGFDWMQWGTNTAAAEALGVGIVVLAVLATPLSTGTGLFIIFFAVTPAVGALALSDLNNGTVSSIDIYLSVAVKAAIIALLSAGIDAVLIVKIDVVAHPFLNFSATVTSGFLSGSSVEAISQFLYNGEIDGRKVLEAGGYSALFSALLWGYQNGLKDPFWKKEVLGDITVMPKSLSTMEEYAKNGIDFETAQELYQFDFPPTSSEYLANQSYWDSAIENMVHYGTYTHPVLGRKQGYWVGDVFIPADKIEIYMRGNVASLSPDEFLQLEEALRQVNGRESKLVGDDAKLLKLQHNYERSQDMSVVLEKIGLPNTKENNDKIAAAMLESFQNMDQKTLKSKAILYGDSAPITIECWWYKDPDGSYRLSTVILGKK